MITSNIWASAWDFQQCGLCNQQSLRSACAYAQSDQSLCWSLGYSMIVRLLTEHHLGFLSLKGCCRGSSESTHVKMPHCWKSHALTPIFFFSRLFEGLHQCVKFFAGYYCYEYDLRNLLVNHISSIAFHFHSNALAASPPTSDRHIDHGLLADFHPDKCHDGNFNYSKHFITSHSVWEWYNTMHAIKSINQ